MKIPNAPTNLSINTPISHRKNVQGSVEHQRDLDRLQFSKDETSSKKPIDRLDLDPQTLELWTPQQSLIFLYLPELAAGRPGLARRLAVRTGRKWTGPDKARTGQGRTTWDTTGKNKTEFDRTGQNPERTGGGQQDRTDTDTTPIRLLFVLL